MLSELYLAAESNSPEEYKKLRSIKRKSAFSDQNELNAALVWITRHNWQDSIPQVTTFFAENSLSMIYANNLIEDGEFCAIHWTIINGNLDFFKLFLLHRPDSLTAQDKEGKIAIDHIIKNKRWNFLFFILDSKDITLDYKKKYCNQVLTALSNYDVLTDQEEAFANSLFGYFFLTADDRQLKELVDKENWGCVADVCDKKKITEYWRIYAAYEIVKKNPLNGVALVTRLLGKNFQYNFSSENYSPTFYWLQKAIKNNNSAMFILLLKMGANLTEKDKKQKTVIDLIVEKKQWNLFLNLAEAKKFSEFPKEYEQALFEVVKANPDNVASIVEHLIKAGVKKNTLRNTENESKGNTIIHLAVSYNQSEVVNFLLANIEGMYTVKNEQGKTAIQMAADLGYWDLLSNSFLKIKNCHKDAGYNEALWMALEKKQWEVAKKLLKVGAGIAHYGNEKQQLDWTPLHVAVDMNSLEIVNFLLENGEDLSAQNVLKQDPMALAVSLKREALFNQFLVVYNYFVGKLKERGEDPCSEFKARSTRDERMSDFVNFLNCIDDKGKIINYTAPIFKKSYELFKSDNYTNKMTSLRKMKADKLKKIYDAFIKRLEEIKINYPQGLASEILQRLEKLRLEKANEKLQAAINYGRDDGHDDQVPMDNNSL